MEPHRDLPGQRPRHLCPTRLSLTSIIFARIAVSRPPVRLPPSGQPTSDDRQDVRVSTHGPRASRGNGPPTRRRSRHRARSYRLPEIGLCVPWQAEHEHPSDRNRPPHRGSLGHLSIGIGFAGRRARAAACDLCDPAIVFGTPVTTLVEPDASALLHRVDQLGKIVRNVGRPALDDRGDPHCFPVDRNGP